MADSLTLTFQRIADFALRVRRDEVLNRGTPRIAEGDIAAQLMRTSKMILAQAVDPTSGLVDYSSIKQSQAYKDFAVLTHALKDFEPKTIGDGPSYTAFWINTYNALIIDAIIHYDLTGSILGQPGLFRQAAYEINGMRFSADDIEHGILRRNRPHPLLRFKSFIGGDPRLAYRVKQFDPRIHFALVCGALSCPPITFYDPDALETQLDLATNAFIIGGGARWEENRNTLWLSRIFDWYADDFGGRREVLGFIREYANSEQLYGLPAAEDLIVRFRPYDWRINRLSG